MSVERKCRDFVDISQVDCGIGKVVRQLKRRMISVGAAGAGEQVGRKVAQVFELSCFTKGAIAADRGEGNGPWAFDAQTERCISVDCAVSGRILAARFQNNDAALEGCELQHTVKRNGLGAV